MSNTHKTGPDNHDALDYAALTTQIKSWALAAGFDAVGITDTKLGEHAEHLQQWLNEGQHGDMQWMQNHADLRCDPDALHSGTIRVISVRMDYLHGDATPYQDLLDQPDKAAISRYAIGRDYHKVLRQRLGKLAKRIEQTAGGRHRAFVDSAPVLEKPLAQKAGIGWVGKHTNLLHQDAGGWFFLGEIYTSLPLPIDQPAENHCGSCQRCIDICPTKAITGPYQLDARLCISYLTIEHASSIPEHLRPLIGNRIYGCDDCIMVCPWNKFAQAASEPDFAPREPLDTPDLVELFAWSEEEFLKHTEGTAIRRIGHERWLRNVAVGLGNAPGTPAVISALQSRLDDSSDLVREHIRWALAQHAENPHLC